MARAGHSPARARLTPTATCCRRSAAQWVARGLSNAYKCRSCP